MFYSWSQVQWDKWVQHSHQNLNYSLENIIYVADRRISLIYISSRNKSAKRGVHLVSMGMTIVCWKALPLILNNMFQIKISGIVIEVKQVFCIIWVFKDWWRFGIDRSIQFRNSDVYLRPHSLNPFEKISRFYPSAGHDPWLNSSVYLKLSFLLMDLDTMYFGLLNNTFHRWVLLTFVLSQVITWPNYIWIRNCFKRLDI